MAHCARRCAWPTLTLAFFSRAFRLSVHTPLYPATLPTAQLFARFNPLENPLLPTDIALTTTEPTSINNIFYNYNNKINYHFTNKKHPFQVINDDIRGLERNRCAGKICRQTNREKGGDRLRPSKCRRRAVQDLCMEGRP